MENKLNFTELVDKVAAETGASRQLVHDLLLESAQLAKEGLDRDGLMIYKGLGRFHLKWHEARNGRNPQTGEEIVIAAHSAVHYKPELDLRTFINRKYSHLKATLLKEKPSAPVEPVKETEPDTAPAPEPAPIFKAETEPVFQAAPKEKKRNLGWLWILALLLIVVLLIYFLWPSSGSNIAQDESLTPPQTAGQQEQAAESEPVVTPQADEQQAAEEEPVTTPQAADQQAAGETPQQPATPVVKKAPAASKGIPAAQHSIAPGQNLWLLSEEYYAAGNLWPNIYRANNENIGNPDEMVTGTDIQIPGLDGKPGSLSSNDLQDIGEGYVQAYLVYKSLGKENANSFLWVAKQIDNGSPLQKYMDKIDKDDLEQVEGMEGSLEIK